jgi:hypothetical protein
LLANFFGENIFKIATLVPRSDTYTVFGTLSIPFAELEEPFAAFADLSNGRSRIDYYGGMDKTFQGSILQNSI